MICNNNYVWESVNNGYRLGGKPANTIAFKPIGVFNFDFGLIRNF